MQNNSRKTIKQSVQDLEERYFSDLAFSLKRFDEMEKELRGQQNLVNRLTFVILDLQKMLGHLVDGKTAPQLELPPEKPGSCRIIDFSAYRKLM